MSEKLATIAELIREADERLTASRLGKSVARETDRDLLTIRHLRNALMVAATRLAAQERDAQHPELVPESVTDAAFASQADWWRPGDEPVQGVAVPVLIESITEAVYRATRALPKENL